MACVRWHYNHSNLFALLACVGRAVLITVARCLCVSMELSLSPPRMACTCGHRCLFVLLVRVSSAVSVTFSHGLNVSSL